MKTTTGVKVKNSNSNDAPDDSIATPCESGEIPEDSPAYKTLRSQGPYNYSKDESYANIKGTALSPYKLEAGAIYEGEWLSGERHGKGK